MPIFLFAQQSSILWKIEKDSVHSYVLGSLHLYGGNLLEKDSTIYNALISSKIIFEENLASSDTIINKRLPKSLLNKLTNIEKQGLERVIDNKMELDKLTLKELHILTDKYLERQSCLDENEKKDTIFMEDYIINLALKKNILIKGLETTSETLTAIEKYAYTDFSEDKLFSFLRYKLSKFINYIPKGNCDIENLYRNKKFNYEFNKINESEIIKNRNFKWMLLIPKMLDKYKNIFITVGLEHLNYKTGLIELLKSKGYNVTPVILKQ